MQGKAIQTQRIISVVAVLALLSGALFYGWKHRNNLSSASTHTEAAHFVGSQACVSCHRNETTQWQMSDHHHAMEPANAQTVLGNFNNTEFNYFGRLTTFSKKDNHYLVSTENQQGQPETFTVLYTLGYKPLQQYLVQFADGRIQTLPFAWDTRSKQEGGQHWFHLYPDEKVTPENPLFWTRPLQNWNYMCADCHTTNFAKNFSDQTNTFKSHWTENGNGCESCHGAGSAHIDLMRELSDKNKKIPEDHDLLIKKMSTQTEQMDNCGVCHARRTRLKEDPANEKMLQTWRPELLHEGLYFTDGQMRDEVFNVGSFMQSKMYAAGVTCTNCHNPHTTKIKTEGDGLCGQCHALEKYNKTNHHFDAKMPVGNQCVSCHMPTHTYMVVDKRHDHYFSVPHADSFEKTFWQSRHEQLAAEASLKKLITEGKQRSIVEATALSELARYTNPDNMAVIEEKLANKDALIRLAATESLAAIPPEQRATSLVKMLDDSSRAVRLAAAPLMLDIDSAKLDDVQIKQRNAVFAEYRTWLEADSDRGTALVSLASFYLAQGDSAKAQSLFEKALQRDEKSLSVYLNYADYYRGQGNDVEAGKLLRKAMEIYPDSPDAYYAWGLLLVRQKQYDVALQALKKARDMAPDNSQFAYVYGVGLYTVSDKGKALDVLAQAHQRFPANQQIVSALLAYCGEQKSTTKACQIKVPAL